MGDGTFDYPGGGYTTSGYAKGLAAGDLNGDHIPDLVVANSGSNSVSILLGAVSGRFVESDNIHVNRGPQAVSLSDLNGDGKLDLVLPSLSDHISILLNRL